MIAFDGPVIRDLAVVVEHRLQNVFSAGGRKNIVEESDILAGRNRERERHRPVRAQCRAGDNAAVVSVGDDVTVIRRGRRLYRRHMVHGVRASF
jgi:hypothetical protein